MGSTTDVIYDPLPQGNYARILEVREAEAGEVNSELICDFRVVSLNNCSANYTAVSYAWEDPTPVSRISFSNGQSLALSQTLHDLFQSIRQTSRSFNLWIDLLCINQHDQDEKASQVRQMAEVYSSAQQVLLWLGSSTPESRVAFRFMESKASLTWPECWEQQKGADLSDLETVFALLARPWFQRAWVIQEITVSIHAVVACGHDRVDFETFRHCVFAVWKFHEGLSDHADDHAAVRGLWNVTRLLYIRNDFRRSGAVPFETLLQAAYHCEATDARDMVFAFWSIAKRDRPLPAPDYRMPVGEIYTKTAEALLCHGTSLDLLALCGTAIRKKPSDLPTWVPDPRNHSYEEPYVPADGASFDAGGPLLKAPTRVSERHIRMQAKPFDVVEVTCPPFDSTSVAKQQAAVRAVLDLRDRARGKPSVAEWMDFLAVSLILGLNCDDEPAGPEYRGYFDEWLAWLQSSTSDEDLIMIRTNRYFRTTAWRLNDRKAFLTRQGFLGIAAGVEVGDTISAVPGCRLPLVLRSKDLRGSSISPLYPAVPDSLPKCTLVTWCWTQGLMYYKRMSQELPSLDILLG